MINRPSFCCLHGLTKVEKDVIYGRVSARVAHDLCIFPCLSSDVCFSRIALLIITQALTEGRPREFHVCLVSVLAFHLQCRRVCNDNYAPIKNGNSVLGQLKALRNCSNVVKIWFWGNEAFLGKSGDWVESRR